ncbi:MDR family MFS transporter [Streptomyces sp. URMC 123]|uniref:MDR family MFS transporter n=1 Tax=Streptomyces sp. URMC 123 TaxID=3423403 RepID=UPI003F1A0905
MSISRLGRGVRASVSGLPRAFWWLWASTLVNRLGGFVATFLALYLTVERGYSASYAGLVAALHGLGGVISSVVGGVLTDRLGRRPTLMISQTATALTVALLGFMEHPAAIAVVAFLVGAASNASRPAVQAMMADIVAPEDRVRAFALNYWAINLGFAFSSVAAGLIAEHSYRAGFLGEAVMTLACAILVFVKLPESRPERAGAAAGAGGAAADGSGGGAADGSGGAAAVGLGSVLRDGPFMGVVGLSFLISLIFSQAYVSLPVAMGEAGFSSSDFGLVIAVNGVLIVLLQLPVTRFIEHRDPGRLLVISALVAGYGFGLTAFADSLAVYALTVCVWTLAEIVNSPTQMGLVVRLSPVHGRGRYQGVYTMSWSVAALVAPLVGGHVIDRYGRDALWLGCALVGTVTGLGYALLMRKVERRGEGAAESPKAPGPAGTSGTPASAGTSEAPEASASAGTSGAPEASARA